MSLTLLVAVLLVVAGMIVTAGLREIELTLPSAKISVTVTISKPWSLSHSGKVTPFVMT